MFLNISRVAAIFFIKRFALALMALMMISLSIQYSALQAQTTAKPLGLVNLRIAGDETRMRIIAVFDKVPAYKIQLLDSPTRLIVNLPIVDFSAQKQSPTVMGLVSNIRYGAAGADRSRIILTTKVPFVVEKSTSQQLDSGLWQVVLDIKTDSRKNFEALLQEQQKNDAASLNTPANSIVKPFRVVIDAGHGGIDSGAQGVSGILEKDVTLAFARALREQLEKNPSLEVFLTRDTDVFLRLNERVQKARGYGADLFISIHADTINTGTMRGATVYTISDKASDNIAKALAERENKSDLLDGLPADETPEVTDILIDLARRETLAFSVNFAERVISDMTRDNINLIKNPHRYAGFQVLKAPDIPSVLIELGYLSNKDDERQVSDPAWRAKAAGAIAMAVKQFADNRRGQMVNQEK